MPILEAWEQELVPLLEYPAGSDGLSLEAPGEAVARALAQTREYRLEQAESLEAAVGLALRYLSRGERQIRSVRSGARVLPEITLRKKTVVIHPAIPSKRHY